MQLRKILISVLVIALAGYLPAAVADHHEKNDGLAQVVKITPVAGKSKALEEAITAYHKFMGDKKGAHHYQWYSIMTGPDTGKYIARTGNHNWADFDAEYDWEEEAGKRFMADVQPLIENVEVMFTRVDQELGIWPESMEGYQYYLVTNWYVKQGHYRAYSQGLKKIDGILKEGGWPNYYSFSDVVSGGKGNQQILVSPRKNFADMAPKEPDFMAIMSKALGEDETAAFMSEWSQTYTAGGNYMVRYRPELSDYGQDD